MKVLIYDDHTVGHIPSWLYCTGLAAIQHDHEVYLAAVDCPEVNHWLSKLDGMPHHRLPIPNLKKGWQYAEHAAQLAREHGCERIVFPFFDIMLMHMDSIISTLGHGIYSFGGIIFQPNHTRHPVIQRLKLEIMKLSWAPSVKMKRTQIRHSLLSTNGILALKRFVGKGNRLKLMSLDSSLHEQQLSHLFPFAELIRLRTDPWLSRSELSQREARRKLSLPQDKFIYLHCGTDREPKGLPDAYQAWKQMPEELRNQTLFLRAGQVTCKNLRQQIEGDGRLFADYIPQDTLDDFYAACDCVLIPYRNHSGTSGVLIHAAAAARPVIAPDHAVIGGMMKNHDLGYCYRHLDRDDLCRAMQTASESKFTPSVRHKDFVNRNSKDALVHALGDFFFTDTQRIAG